jgi:hypothetical protein
MDNLASAGYGACGVGEHVTDPPALTPGRTVPCRIVERFHPVRELATQTSCLLPYIHGLTTISQANVRRVPLAEVPSIERRVERNS